MVSEQINLQEISLDEYRHLVKKSLDKSPNVIEHILDNGTSINIIKNASPHERKTLLRGVKYVGFIANLTTFNIWLFDLSKIDFFDVALKIGLPIKKSRVSESICGYINLASPEQELISNNRSRIKLFGNLSDSMWCRKFTMHRLIKTFEKTLLKLSPRSILF